MTAFFVSLCFLPIPGNESLFVGINSIFPHPLWTILNRNKNPPKIACRQTSHSDGKATRLSSLLRGWSCRLLGKRLLLTVEYDSSFGLHNSWLGLQKPAHTCNSHKMDERMTWHSTNKHFLWVSPRRIREDNKEPERSQKQCNTVSRYMHLTRVTAIVLVLYHIVLSWESEDDNIEEKRSIAAFWHANRSMSHILSSSLLWLNKKKL